MKILSTYLKVNSFFEKAEKIIAVSIISAIVLIVFSSTVSRYLFSYSFFGADRLATYLMVWLGFIGFQIATSKSRHIEIEFVKSKLKPHLRYIFNIITALLATVVLLIFTFLSVKYVHQTYLLEIKDMTLDIKLWKILLVLPLSFFVSAIRFFFSTFLWYDVLKGRRDEKDIVSNQII